MREVAIPRLGAFEAWRDAARALVADGVGPGDVLWRFDDEPGGLFGADDPAPPPDAARRGATPAATQGPRPAAEIRTSRAFLDLARTACHHADPAMLGHLHDVLWRSQTGPVRLDDRGDDAVAALRAAEKTVRRDAYKMRAFLRFRELPADPRAARRRFAAWFEPEHTALPLAAPFFARRFADMDWAIATPQATARFKGGALEVGPPESRPDLPPDATEAMWQTYFASIFNPARLKTKAMLAEMPRKYWRNLPEAALISDLTRTAQDRARAMQTQAPTAPARHAAPAVALGTRKRMDLFSPQTLDGIRRDAQGCTRCPLHADATQLVFGEGPQDADVMVVGEQPGDQEDLQGRPFVGPAGQLFDTLAVRAGLERDKVYVTNAVKHFKFIARGKRRIHQRPSAGEVSHCRWWLDLEREVVRPKLTIAMGATALHALTGDGRGILKRRGRVEAARDGGPVFVTVHPSYLLRLPDAESRSREEAAFTSDLRAAAEHPSLAA